MENDVIIVDNFLDQSDLEYYLDYIQKSRLTQNIVDNPDLVNKFWEKYKDRLPKIDFSGMYSKVTITNSTKPVIRHVDVKYKNEKYKLLIYLNNIKNGGTIFYKEKEKFLVENRQNRLVLFDISLPHESQHFISNTKKIAIGFRLF